jgi:hypothetical protein
MKFVSVFSLKCFGKGKHKLLDMELFQYLLSEHYSLTYTLVCFLTTNNFLILYHFYFLHHEMIVQGFFKK